jgi:PAS domain S-box-containing protein
MISRTFRTIFIDDSTADYELAVRTLRDSGINVETVLVETRNELLRELADFKPEIVISDYMMPSFDGMSALLTVKEHDEFLPFIILTGSMNEMTAVECMKAGATDYVIKEHLARLPVAFTDSMNKAQMRRERIEASRALIESERRYRSYIDNAPYGVFVADKKGCYCNVNNAACTMTGYTREELIGLNIIDLLPSEDRTRAGKALEKLATDGYSDDVSTFIRKDGSRGIWSIRAVAVSPDSYLGFTLDITQEEELRNSLRESRNRLRKSQELAMIGSWELDLASMQLWVARQARHICGLGEGDIDMEAVRKLPLPQHRGSAVKLFREILSRKRRKLESEFTIRRPSDGELVELRVIAELDDTGSSLEGAVQDVTLHKNLEQDLSSLFMLSPDMVCIACISTSTFQSVNPSFTRVLGWSESELLSRPFTEFTHPDDLESTQRVVTEQLAKGIEVPRFENRYRCRDGSYRTLMWSSHPVPERNLTYAVAHDITELRRSEQERLEFERKLLHSQKLESLGLMAGGIAHDFNNLLMAVQGNLEMALLDLPDDSKTSDSVRKAMTASKRAVNLAGQVLAYSGRRERESLRINLTDLMKENVHMLKAIIPKTIELELELDDHLPCVSGDVGQLQQVIMNLITNAAEAIESSAGSVKLTTRTRLLDIAELQNSILVKYPDPGEYVVLTVEDTGIGMIPETVEKIFDPFFTSKPRGRGLGMSSVLGIVRGHGGALFIHSTPGEGTIVTVALPVCKGSDEEKIHEELVSDETDRSEQGQVDKGIILVVDDEESVLNICSAMVGKIGYGVLKAVNGEQAYSLFEDNIDKIVCVIMDLSMPRMDGMNTVRKIFALRNNVPVLLSSGYDRSIEIMKMSDQHPVNFLQKPYSFSDLKQALNSIMQLPQKAD